MTLIFPKFRDCFLASLLATALLAPAAHAGSISFGLSLTDNQLTLTNHGNSSAFYTTVLRLLSDGRWEVLTPASTGQASVEMRPNAQFSFNWPETKPPASLPNLETLQPLMVRFFDQAGAGFGQISFFNSPPSAADDLNFPSRYVDGKMRITSPEDRPVAVSWLLWPQEEGIAPLTSPVQFTHRQPDARKIEWRTDMNQVSFDLGSGLPSSYLLHQTAQGFVSQVLQGGGVQGRQQRTRWLDAGSRFEWLAQLAAAAATALFAWHLAASWRTRSGQ